MQTTKLIKSVALAALLASGSAFAAPVELLLNGSFEANVQAAGTWANYDNLTGWTGGTHGIELRNHVFGSAANGVNFVELDTYKNSSMTQTVQTVLGQHYTLSFQFQDRINVPTSSQGLSVDWGGAEIAHVNDSLNGAWETRTYTLIGDGSAMKLKFIATGRSDSLGTSLDNVSLTSAVPEPETYAMMLAGLGLVGFAARRRKAAK
ncbi:FxDxF family PEP-CTERM protein [Duganella violaceipulchra]|uniref:FxDxF family PEP-CTERM protein n=1 Tax=Duganella violaceipulchra TaxID=2849652 RepID=A0AA41H5T8_9BURK|nr:FxDxF family PEP-CTERM protein [Duganella violaceicalia]MBV6319565.1 FxDxF family PEP-CTERM protein [Duganella violaceicalia]MCP2006623.1 hypothetical protein [Duganella violaceicalia]